MRADIEMFYLRAVGVERMRGAYWLVWRRDSRHGAQAHARTHIRTHGRDPGSRTRFHLRRWHEAHTMDDVCCFAWFSAKGEILDPTRDGEESVWTHREVGVVMPLKHLRRNVIGAHYFNSNGSSFIIGRWSHQSLLPHYSLYPLYV